MRKLNISKLRQYLEGQGKMAIENLSVETGISFFKLSRMLRNERSASKPEMIALCLATNLDINELFPEIRK
jgi:hypothetical protein